VEEDILPLAAVNPKDGVIGIFPNPARDEATLVINLEADEEVDLRLIDLQGRTHYRADRQPFLSGQNMIPIETGTFQPGTYFLQVRTAKYKETVRLVIQR
jgi:hypothetical protein